jgi:heptosyltransferase-2
MRIAVFLPNWIGDVVMATPTLRALRTHFGPRAELIGVMRPYVSEVLAGTDWLSDTLLYDPRSQQTELRTLACAKHLRDRKPDVAFLLTNSLRTGLIAWLSGAPRRVGYAHYGRGPLLTDKLKFAKSRGRFVPTPTLDAYLRLAALLGCDEQPVHTELQTTSEDEARADEVWRKLGLSRDEEIVLINSGGAYGAAKSWPSEYFSELARRIASRHGLTVLVLCGPAEREMAADIVKGAGHPQVLGLAEQELSIGLSKACVRRSRLMISTDSGPRHFAAAFDVPVMTLYGPTHIAWGDTHYPRAIHLQREVPCGPCMKRICPLGHHRCMTELTADEVYRAVVTHLEAERKAMAG